MPELGHLIEHWGYLAVFVFIGFKTEDTHP
jgi:hypothetical protein